MRFTSLFGLVLLATSVSWGQIILPHADFDLNTGPNVNCYCPDYWDCGDDAGGVDLTYHPVYSPGDQGCSTGQNYMPEFSNYSPPRSMYFYGGADFAFHQTPVDFLNDDTICMGVWYCGPQTPGTTDQNTSACYFQFAIDGLAVGPQIPVPDGTNWTLISVPVPISAGMHTFGLVSGDPGQYAIWFDNFHLDTNNCFIPQCNPGWVADTINCPDQMINLDAFLTGDAGGTWSGTGVQNGMFDPTVGTQDITYTLPFPCDTALTQTIVVNGPIVNLSTANVSCYGMSDGWAAVNVTGSSTNLVYNWSNFSTSDSIYNLFPGNYTVTIEDTAAMCTFQLVANILQPSPINVDITVVDACEPEFGSLDVTASGGTGRLTYTWQHSADTAAFLSGLDSGYYYFTVTDSMNCTETDSALVTVYPGVELLILSDTTIAYGECVVLDSWGDSIHAWSPEWYLDCSECQTPTACPEMDTTYCAFADNSYGCADTACVQIKVHLECGEVFVPTAFSPNDDGVNDLHCIYSPCFDEFTLSIYNRWGERIFETSDPNNCWDGTFEGKSLNMAVFAYVLNATLINGEVFYQAGNISLVR